MQVRDPHTGALRLLAHHEFGPEAAKFWTS
jgi:hypothetical protein